MSIFAARDSEKPVSKRTWSTFSLKLKSSSIICAECEPTCRQASHLAHTTSFTEAQVFQLLSSISSTPFA